MEQVKQLQKKGITMKNTKPNPAAGHKYHNVKDAFLSLKNYLQKKYGNYRVGRMVESGCLQAQIKISSPGDIYEREADQTADKVLSMPEQDIDKQQTPEEETTNRQAAKEEDEKINPDTGSDNSLIVRPALSSVIKKASYGGEALPKQTRNFFEKRFGTGFGNVRVHHDEKAQDSARIINARAYTLGNHIVFGKGEYSPASPQGRRLLAHELTHVVQQGGIEKSVDRYEAGEHAQLGETGDQLRQSMQKSYTVLKGEMPDTIANKFGISVKKLKEANKDKLKKWPATDGSGRMIEGFNANETIMIPVEPNEMAKKLVEGKSAKIIVNNVELEYGVMIAMGDLFESPAQMAAASADELKTLRDLIKREQAGGKLVTTDEWVAATNGRYLKLAEKNTPHFAPSNPGIAKPAGAGAAAGNHKTEWEKYHQTALDASRAGEKDKALMINAYGDHFLTDAFSTGHLINKPDIMGLFKDQIKKESTAKDADFDIPSKAFFDNVAAQAFTGDVVTAYSDYETYDKHYGFHPNIDTVDMFSRLLQGIYDTEPDLVAGSVAKAVHDTLNTVPGGIPVENAKGDKWNLSGDTNLNAETKKVALKAVAQSQTNIASVYKLIGALNYPDLYKQVWDFTPNLTKESTTTVRQIANKGTNIGEKPLIDAVVKLIKDNYLLIRDQLVDRKKLKKA